MRYAVFLVIWLKCFLFARQRLLTRHLVCTQLSPGMVNTKSFPKPEGRKGVRSVESVEDSLFAILESGVNGHYIHADELDVVRAKGLDDRVALKPIREATFFP